MRGTERIGAAQEALEHVEPFRLPHDPATVARKKREIAARYNSQHWDSKTGVAQIMRFRVHDLERIIRGRYGNAVPDNAVGRDLLFALAHTVAGCARRVAYGRGPRRCSRTPFAEVSVYRGISGFDPLGTLSDPVCLCRTKYP